MKFLILYILYVYLKKNNNILMFKIKKNIVFSLNII